MQLRGSGTGPGQATAWLQAAAWLRMGPMGPRGLGPKPADHSRLASWGQYGNAIGNAIGNTIGNSIGNSIKKY